MFATVYNLLVTSKIDSRPSGLGFDSTYRPYTQANWYETIQKYLALIDFDSSLYLHCLFLRSRTKAISWSHVKAKSKVELFWIFGWSQEEKSIFNAVGILLQTTFNWIRLF